MTIAATSLILTTVGKYDSRADSLYSQAEALYADEDYFGAIRSIFQGNQIAGTKTPDHLLELYYPMPDDYLDIVIANRPETIQALPIDEQATFVLYFFSLIRRESIYDRTAVSPDGAKGLGQIMPNTAKWIADKMKLNILGLDLNNKETNLRMALFYFGWLVTERFGIKNIEACLAAYNAGHDRVEKILTSLDDPADLMNNLGGNKETHDYVGYVEGYYQHYNSLYRTDVSQKLAAAKLAKRQVPSAEDSRRTKAQEKSIFAWVMDYVWTPAIAAVSATETAKPNDPPVEKYVSAEEMISDLFEPPKAAIEIKSQYNLVIVGYTDNETDAAMIISKLKDSNIKDCYYEYEPQNQRYRVQAGAFHNFEYAEERLNQVSKLYKHAFIIPPQ